MLRPFKPRGSYGQRPFRAIDDQGDGQRCATKRVHSFGIGAACHSKSLPIRNLMPEPNVRIRQEIRVTA
jgi:hypothetical protein